MCQSFIKMGKNKTRNNFVKRCKSLNIYKSEFLKNMGLIQKFK